MDSWSTDFLSYEALALQSRLDRVQPFVLNEVMVPAANLSQPARSAIERYLATGREELRGRINQYLTWLFSPSGRRASLAEAQRRFTVLRLLFNRVLTQFDLFADTLSQRSERDNGVWLAGLDVLAADALALPGYYESPPVVCYLDRGVGAAIRRARTRLPGGGENPVAVIRVPRERMVGSGIASSLVHEVGHQSAALLGLVDSLRPVLRDTAEGMTGTGQTAWRCFERWISEIVADFWSVARVGITSTMGLIGVVSLPRAFVFRINLEDPHPAPWIRVKLSCAIGRALFPHPQWQQLEKLWEGFYPPGGLDPEKHSLLRALESHLDAFVALLLDHRPASLGGRSLEEVMQPARRHPRQLSALYRKWQAQPRHLYQASPSMVFAALGQQRADGEISPAEESRALSRALARWALHRSLDRSPTGAPTLSVPATTFVPQLSA